MREFYSSYAEKDATTADFQRVVESTRAATCRGSREWVYGTGIRITASRGARLGA
jgi:hypothetical protein